MTPPRLRVLRTYHSGVVAAWRERDRQLRALGTDVTLVSPARWNEGGRDVALTPAADEAVVVAPTVGRHPYVFAYDPRPLWRALRAGQYDVLDVHEEPASLAALEVVVLARLAGQRAPFCLYCAQNLEKRYPVPFRWIEQALLRRAEGVHTCNEQAGAILRGKGFSGRLCNLGLGVDVARFRPGPAVVPDGAAAPGDHERGEARLHVGYVGRLERRKGVFVLLDACARLDDADLTFVGDGPARDELTARIDHLGLSGRASVDGFASQDDLPTTYRRFDVLAVPSLDTPGWIEQFGRVAVEAMASGVPIVASDSGSLPEVVGDAGLLVPPGDAEALAGALATFADRAHRASMSRRAVGRARRWSWPAIAERQLAFYRDLVADAERRTRARRSSTSTSTSSPSAPSGVQASHP